MVKRKKTTAKKVSKKTSRKKKPAQKKPTKKVAKRGAKSTKSAARKSTKKKITRKSSVPSTMPQIGRKAPAWSLPATPDGKIKLADFKGKKNIVLYFYPKDDTPGCTVEAQTFQKDLAKYRKSNTIIIGVSPDSIKSHQRFSDKYGLAFALLSDEGAKLAKTYGVWVEKNMYGRKYMGIQRATFLIDKQGKVAALWPKVKVAGHSQEVLGAIKDL